VLRFLQERAEHPHIGQVPAQKVVYRFLNSQSDVRTELRLAPLELIERLAA
jgi:hypothetical protein